MMTEADLHAMSAFSCGVKELDNFFNHEIEECVKHRYLAPYCAALISGEIIAAFTLMNDALVIKSHDEKLDFIEDMKWETDEKIADFFNRQTSYPAINIGHLGTSLEFQGLGVGSSIIDLVVDTFRRDRRSGCQFITVDALNNSRTTGFYTRNLFNFQTLRDSYKPTRRMYRILLPLQHP